MRKQFYICFKPRTFWLLFGWFSGDFFSLLKINILEVDNDAGVVTLLHLQIVKLVFSFGFENEILK